ncbi:ATP-binding protein [Niallia oryzisoli]|uniref:histidine kinase n=1 Tax=Niallia oryzisoli TaxID=1737571 RepID=A0ABZ2CJM1_9BACI
MKFRTKLFGSIGLIILLISISVIYLMNMLEQSMVNMHVVVNDLYARIDIANEIKSDTNQSNQFGIEILEDQLSVNPTAIDNWESSNLRIGQNIELLKELDKQEISKELIEKYRALHDSSLDTIQQVITMQKTNQSVETSEELLNDIKLNQERMKQITSLLVGLQEQEMKNELLRSRETYNKAVTIIYIYLAITLCSGAALIIIIIGSMTKNLKRLASVMESVNDSNVDNLPRIKVSTKDEIASIANAYNKMVADLESHSQHERKLLAEAEAHSWHQSKIAEIVKIYPEAKDIRMLAELLMSKLVPMVGANFGVFYYKKHDGEKTYLQRMAGYAITNDQKEYEVFQMGEGLIGQCALEKQPILLNKVPKEYIKIRSGIGEILPRNSMILPVLFENEVLAVIEIATFDTFEFSQIKLLEDVAATLGITVNSISNHMKAERLLQESQSLTEELQVQSEELQLQQEELRTTNEKLEEQYAASEQKKQELEIVKEALEEKAMQLEVNSKYKSEFLANMSHELRTPLNSLLILAQILADNGEGNLTEKQREYLSTIYSSGNDLLLLINDILDLAKVESGKLEIIQDKVDLKQIEEQLMKQFSPLAKQKELDFQIRLEPDVPLYFYSDKHRLIQIVNNLLSNAFKFTERGCVSLVIHSLVRDNSGQETQRNNPAEKLLAFSVIDTGIGISKEKHDSIFEAFNQADGTTSRKYGGTGLGLSICRKLASMLGGYIELSSVEGKGSTFTLYLPIQREGKEKDLLPSVKEASVALENSYDSINSLEQMTEENSIQEDAEHSALRHKKVLIIDDDIRNVYALTIALERAEMEIIEAENGYEGIEMLLANPDTDIILMDIMMPEMDGFEAIQRIRQMQRYKTLPIIALTAKAMKKSREECLAAGANDYISKPLNIDQLFSLMNVWLYKKRG